MIPRAVSSAALLCLLLVIHVVPECHALSLRPASALRCAKFSSSRQAMTTDMFSSSSASACFVETPRAIGKRKEARGSRTPLGVKRTHRVPSSSSTALSMAAEEPSSILGESDQTALGLLGTLASLIVFYSEFTLKTTGCGLPAGPFGLLGAAEGVSYLAVVGVAAFSLYTKLKTGTGLPAGPGGILGAAEGLSFVAILSGLVVLGFQIADYGYIPNAVPVEGGMCS